jgi:hypothetical protein
VWVDAMSFGPDRLFLSSPFTPDKLIVSRNRTTRRSTSLERQTTDSVEVTVFGWAIEMKKNWQIIVCVVGRQHKHSKCNGRMGNVGVARLTLARLVAKVALWQMVIRLLRCSEWWSVLRRTRHVREGWDGFQRFSLGF